MKKIFFFNGPPSAGKDTSAKLMNHVLGENCYHYKMALPLKEGSHSLLGLIGSLEDFEPLKQFPVKFPLTEKFVKEYNEQSPFPRKTLIVDHEEQDKNGITLREFYIYLSENVMKPLFGDDIFGRLAVEYIKQADEQVVTISDSGFKEEAVPIVEHFGAENCCVVRLHRPDCSFANDSRSFIDLSDLGVGGYDVKNNGSFEDLTDSLTKITNEVLNRKAA